MVKGNNKKLLFYLLAFSFIINTLVTTYTEEPIKPASRKVLLFFEKDKASKWLKEDLLLLYDSLLIKLVQECRTTTIFEAPVQFATAPNDADKSKLTAKANCDAWVAISIKPAKRDADKNQPALTEPENAVQDTTEQSDELPPIQILVRSYDLRLKREVIRFEWKATERKKIERLYWGELVQALNSSYKKRSYESPISTVTNPLAGNCQVIIKAVPGTVITGLTNGSLTIDKTGEARLELSQSRTYTLQANCQGYFPLTETLYPAASELNHALKQQQTSNWAASFYLQNLCYPGIEGTYFLSSQTWYLRASLSLFHLGIPEWVVTEQTAEPVADLTASTGVYLLKPDNFFRFYFAFGCFLRLVERSQSYLIETNNLTLLYGLYPVGGIEFSPYTRLRCYVEYTPLFYLHPSFTIQRLAVELLAFNLGIRVLF